MNQELSIQENNIFEYRVKIGNAIRGFREKRGYSQIQLSEMMNVTTSTISKIESGKFNFNIDFLSKFSTVLNFELELIENKKTKLTK